MIYKILFILLFVIYGCSNQKKDQSSSLIEQQSKVEIEKITHSIGEVLNPDAKKLIERWKEYHSVEETIIEYYNITPIDALSKAKALSELTQQLKDSIRIKQFDKPDIKIRLNVLHNTALRLTDMENISEIENEEIKLEVSNLVKAFSSINNKINNTINKRKLEEQLTRF